VQLYCALRAKSSRTRLQSTLPKHRPSATATSRVAISGCCQLAKSCQTRHTDTGGPSFGADRGARLLFSYVRAKSLS
jgi:hypothetical protein